MFNQGTPLSLYRVQPQQQSNNHAEQPLPFNDLPPPTQPPPHPPTSSFSSLSSSRPPYRSSVQLRPLTIAVVGCAHGELSSIHTTLAHLSSLHHVTIDLLLCCGDFQAIRNPTDLTTLACPPKYRTLLPSFPALYFHHTPPPPYVTVYIGGNHENSLLHCQLPYGGWVAPRHYYVGFAGVVRVGGWRIGGLSGIWKDGDGGVGRWERLPLDERSLRSVYHVRWFDAWRLLQLVADDEEAGDRLAVFMSHDWPCGIARHGNLNQLLRAKPFLRDEIDNGSLGSKPAETLLRALHPLYWFSAHLHVKFAALYQHEGKGQPQAGRQVVGGLEEKREGVDGGMGGSASADLSRVTRFLALDKALPNRDFMQILPLTPHAPSPIATASSSAAPSFSSSSSSSSSSLSDSLRPLRLQYDLDWLCILRKTAHLTPLTRQRTPLPTTSYRPTDDDRRNMSDRLRAAYRKRRAQQQQQQQQQDEDEDEDEAMFDVPLSFVPTVSEEDGAGQQQPPTVFVRDEQTRALFELLGVEDTFSAAMEAGSGSRHGQRAAAGHPLEVAAQQPMRGEAAGVAAAGNPDEIDIDCDSDEGEDGMD